LIKLSNCIYVFVFFALISFLAFFPANTRKQSAGETLSPQAFSASTPIPQKADRASMQKPLKGWQDMNR